MKKHPKKPAKREPLARVEVRCMQYFPTEYHLIVGGTCVNSYDSMLEAEMCRDYINASAEAWAKKNYGK